MNDLYQVETIHVAAQHFSDAFDFLRDVGHSHQEAFALWVGQVRLPACHVRQTVIPEQHAITVGNSVAVTVAGPELFRINKFLFENKFRIIAQLHSHPAEAYHSSTDDLFPISTQIGSLSIVVPNFAHEITSISQCAVYRLNQQPIWVELDPSETAQLIKIED